MKKITYEKPGLIRLNEVAYGQCHSGSNASGKCHVGTWPGNGVCGVGNSTSNCTRGAMATMAFDVDR